MELFLWGGSDRFTIYGHSLGSGILCVCRNMIAICGIKMFRQKD